MSCDPLLKFWDSLNISGTVEGRNFKLGTEINLAVSTNEKNAKLGQRGHVGSSDPLLKFWDPLISRERFKLKTSILVRRQTAVRSNEKMQN